MRIQQHDCSGISPDYLLAEIRKKMTDLQSLKPNLVFVFIIIIQDNDKKNNINS